MTILYLCEKPSQGRDIARVLGVNQRNETHLKGKDIIVTWCIGHLLETVSPDFYCDDLKPWRLEKLPIVPKAWQMQVVEKTKKQFNAIKKLLKETQHVVIATDADREGEVIAREILGLCCYNGKIERLWLSALDDASIKKALLELKDGTKTEKLYFAGLARQRADWLVGMNLTMAATSLFSQRGEGVLSVGRVQTPTLKLVVNRDREIENFKSKDYFVLLVQFTAANQESFWATWQVPHDIADEEGHCLNKEIIESILSKIKEQSAVVSDFTESNKQQSPPLCLSLSALQKLASSRFGFSAKQTLEIAQSLYEKHKATTYPRTDCGYLPESQLAEANLILKNLVLMHPELRAIVAQCDIKIKSSSWNDKKITAHHGIIPTSNSQVDIKKMSADELKLYDLICRYYVAQFLGNYIFNHRSVLVHYQNETFKATSSIPVTSGWRLALQETEEEVSSNIPLLKQDEALKTQQQRIETKQTKPPARFTEGTLIDAMKNIGKYVTNPELKKVLKETAGIGTEATRANILETLLRREYLTRKGKQLISTQKGRALINLLPSTITDPATTAQWEQELENIVDGNMTLDTFLQHQAKNLEVLLDALAAKKANH